MKKILKVFPPTFFILVIWQFKTFFIPMIHTVIFIMLLTLNFIILVALIFNMHIKLICMIEIFIHFSFNISMIFLGFILSSFSCFMFGCFTFPVLVLLFCVSAIILLVSYLCFTSFNDYYSSSHSVFVHIHNNTDKMQIAFKVIIIPLQMIYC